MYLSLWLRGSFVPHLFQMVQGFSLLKRKTDDFVHVLIIEVLTI